MLDEPLKYSADAISLPDVDAMEDHQKLYCEAGMNDVVAKPIDRALLAAAIDNVMGRKIHRPVAFAEDIDADQVEVSAEDEAANLAASAISSARSRD
ncbi:MAG: hypothetical protein VW405_03325 [Rhodospirillaceae bacterium]